MNEQHEALKKFSYQIEYAVSHYNSHGLSTSQFNNIVIGGLGGSGIGGRIAKSLFAQQFPVPIECINDYSLPGYVNEKTLVILCSYSGNTEETLTMYEAVKSRQSICLVVTSGGKIEQMAQKDHLHLYQMERGFQPRMALGYSLTYLVLILGELMGKDVKGELLAVASKLNDSQPYQNDATQLFESIKSKLKNKLLVLSDGLYESVAVRFAQQVQENAKHECFVNALPEMNHNVIESYYGQLETIFFFIDSQQNERVSARFEFLHNLLEVENNKVIDILLDEFSIASVYETIHILDWLSLFIADYRHVDSLNVPNIASLKEFLENT